MGLMFQEARSIMVGKVWQREQEESRGMDSGVQLAFAFLCTEDLSLWNSRNSMTHT